MDIDLFRKEAVANASRAFEGVPVIRSPALLLTVWRRFGISAFLTLSAFWVLVPVPEYATALAILDYASSADVVATVQGQVSSISVEVGQRVSSGDGVLLLRSDELARSFDSLTARLNSLLFETPPGQDAGSVEVSRVAKELQLVRENISRLSILAPSGGTVGSVRVRVGEVVMPGTTVVSLIPENSELEFIAFPSPAVGEHLRTEDRVNLTISSVPPRILTAAVRRIAPVVLSGAAARRTLQAQSADLLSVSGAVMVAHLTLDAPSKAIAGRDLFPGTTATAYFQLGRRTMLARTLQGQ